MNLLTASLYYTAVAIAVCAVLLGTQMVRTILLTSANHANPQS